MLPTPEFVEAEAIKMLHKIKIAPELQHRMLAEGMMWGKKGAKA
jgi:hypothetical protein